MKEDLKQSDKQFKIVYYGHPVYLTYEPLKQRLWSRGFIDKNIYLADKVGNQSLFTIQPKKGLYGADGKKNIPVLFGSQILIRHSLSEHYISIKEINEIPVLQFHKQQSSACYFQFISLRTFQGNGNPITTDSLFLIEHAQRKLYITPQQDEQLQDEVCMLSPRFSPRSTLKKIIKQKSNINVNNNKLMNSQQLSIRQSKKPSSELVTKTAHNVQIIQQQKLDFFKKLKKKKTISPQLGSSAQQFGDVDFKKIVSEDRPDDIIQKLPPLGLKSISMIDRKKLDEIQKNNLIVYQPEKQIRLCHAENHSSRQWKIQLVSNHCRNHYFDNYEFVYFTYSQDDRVLVIDVQKKPYKAAFEINYFQQYLASSIFVVQIEAQDRVYLRHYLTGRYFPFHDDPNQKLRFRLTPLLPPKKKHVPPFKIIFGTHQFSLEGCEKTQNLHGFWLNKAPKKQLAEIVSFQNVNKLISLNYFIEYLRTNTYRHQKTLRQFQFIPYIIEKLIPAEQDQNIVSLCYKLLFYICKNNQINKKKCIFFIQKILQERRKYLILDLLTELLGDSSNNYVLEKAVTPKIIQNQIIQFAQSKVYSIQFMRIFRVFCGPEEQTCVRNQNLIFNLFFWGQTVNQGKNMTESVINAQKKIEVLHFYKFRLLEKQNKIYLSNGNQQLLYQNWCKQPHILSYIRQYYYLLSDCMNNSNFALIKQFTQHISLSLLLKLLKKQQMRGPCLSLIINAYLKPQRHYKSQIFHQDYDQICDKGSMIAMNVTDDGDQLRNFLIQQIENNSDYKSTTFRILLNAFKYTIDNGYWKSYQRLLQIGQNLNGIILQPQNIHEYHQSYEQKVQQKNLMKSKIISISIKIALIDLRICLWVSDFVSGIYTQEQIDKKIADLIKKNKDWIINQNIFKLCSTNSPQLMRKSLLLMYKMYNIQKLFYKTYGEAWIEIQSNLKLNNIFTILHNTKSELTIQNYFSLISACVKDVSMSQLNPQNISKNYRSLESLFKYKQVNEQVQNMAYKLGLHQQLLKDIKRFNGLRKKQKQQQMQVIYWKLVLLYAMIRNNLKLRDIISQYRHIIICIIQNEDMSYYVAADIIEQIYRNNRRLIISDTQQLKQICSEISKAFNTRNGQIDLKCCKVVNLLGVFIQSGNRKIMQNHQIILKNIFTKNVINEINKLIYARVAMREAQYQGKQKLQNKNKFQDILQIVIYDLLSSMGQKKLLMQFQRPNNQTINSLLLSIGSDNWSLKSKAFSCINFREKMPEKLPIQFLNLILYDLNVMCESLHTSLQSQFKQFAKQVKIYVSNMRKILSTINYTFDYICQSFYTKLQNIQSDQVIMIIKIVERLHIMKSMCPLIVRKDIQDLVSYVTTIEQKLKKNNIQYNLVRSILIVELGDFTKKQLKDKLPLIFYSKIKTKQQKGNRSLYQQSKSLVQKQVKKKMRWSKISKGNIENFSIQNIKNQMIQLQTFLHCLNYVNKTDPTVLEDNIKQFLANFLRTSYLTGQQGPNLIIMQNILVEYEIPSVICSFLSQPFKQRYKLFSSIFSLGIKLLEGGHTLCQQKFLQYFKQDAKNWIFQNIYCIIQDSLKTIEFYYKYKEDPTIKSYEMMLEFEEVYICKQQRKLACKVLGNAFRFLQLLCENDHHQMKQYVYNQYDLDGQIKYMSKNFIEIASTILERVFDVLAYNATVICNYPDKKFEEEVRQNIFVLPNYILDFLIEVCQIPAEQNQLYLCRTDFFDFIKNVMVLRENCKKDDSQMFVLMGQNMFFQLQRKIIILLRSLLEQDSEQIINLMSKKLGKQQFQFFIQQSCIHGGLEDTQKLRQMLTSYKLNGYVQNILDVLIVKKILKFECIFSFDSQKLNIIDQLNSRIQSIHVDFKGHPMTVYFPFHPLFSLLKKKTKMFLLDRTANLNTRKQKITDFLLSREVVYQDINLQKNADHKLMNQKNMGYVFNFALLLCYLIIFLLILFYSVSKSGIVLDIYQNKIISSIAYMQLIVAFIYTIVLGFNQIQIVSQKLKTKHRYSYRNQLILEGSKNIAEQQQFARWKLIKAIYFGESDSFHATFLLFISIYACFIEIRMYSLSLLFVFVKIQFLQSIFKAIKLTWKQLIFVSIFALAFSLIFGFLTINNYIGPLYQNQEIDIDINRINQHCNSMFTCVGSLYTQKIIGESVGRQDEQYNYRRFFSDLIYDAFFNIFLTNIIAAIIIDKFAEQRNVKQKIQNDRYSSCYICFADKATLQRRGEDFNSHVTNSHNLWNYFFYMYTLENLKDITDFTGIQYWINRQMQQNLIDWVPIDDSLKQETTNIAFKDHSKHRKKVLHNNTSEKGDSSSQNSDSD